MASQDPFDERRAAAWQTDDEDALLVVVVCLQALDRLQRMRGAQLVEHVDIARHVIAQGCAHGLAGGVEMCKGARIFSKVFQLLGQCEGHGQRRAAAL